VTAVEAPSLMRREIGEQPEAVARTLDALIPLESRLRRLGEGRRDVAFVARGSSDNAAVYGRYLCEAHAGRNGRLMAPSIATQYGRRLPLHDTLVVSLSQSGATEEIVETTAWARACGARTVAVTNTSGSPLAEVADLALVTHAGAERAVPATKTYTTQLAALAVLGIALGPRDDALASALRDVPDEIARATRSPLDDRVLDAFAAGGRAIATGRGYVLSNALELALKLLETCLLPSIGLSSADLVHGPIAAVRRGTPVAVLAPPAGPLLPGLSMVARRLRAAGAFVFGCGGDDGFAAACDHAIAAPSLPEPLAPLALIVPGQLLVEALARRLGLDPDAPPGLDKVTQTDHCPPSTTSRESRRCDV
jgi:glucosamine--fructose-6-phosphate aminotransferase (isomerizing)